MARENKTTRDARRFGLYERLIDRAINPDQWGVPSAQAGLARTDKGRESLAKSKSVCIEGLLASNVVCADNVAEYFFAQNPQEEWEYRRDFPCCKPPFDSTFVEMGRPSRLLSGSDVKSADHFAARWGWLITALDVDTPARVETMRRLIPSLGADLDAVSFYKAILFMQCTDGSVLSATIGAMLPLDATGAFVDEPAFYLTGDYNDGTYGTGDDLSNFISGLLFPAVLALSFMNCKNVQTTVNRPDAAINRARKAAGMAPFVRYHTININPMKEVLRTEGGVEHNGLSKALHICRGHFATLTRNNKGNALEKPTTYYREAHVRGSAERGLVVSDYAVNAPSAN